MCRSRRFVVLAALALSSFAAVAHAATPPHTKLAEQSRERLTTIARTITIVNWAGNINEAIGSAPAAQSLGKKWNPSEPHWDKAFDEILTAVMARFDQLHDAPEALERMQKPFETNFTDKQASEVLALTKEQRTSLDDYADTLTLAVSLLEHSEGMKAGSPEYTTALGRLTGMAKLPKIDDVPKLPLSEKTMEAYRQTRSSSVDFYQTAMDGQLKLFFFDNRDSITAIIDKAAHAAKAK
jgi:hypothetical protein